MTHRKLAVAAAITLLTFITDAGIGLHVRRRLCR
jgi:hypothetical protein